MNREVTKQLVKDIFFDQGGEKKSAGGPA